MRRTLGWRRLVPLLACVAVLANAVGSSPAAAGLPTGQRFDVAQGEVVSLGAAADALSSAAPVSGTRSWWANYQNQGPATVTNASVTIASGYAASLFNANGAPVTGFPLKFSTPSVPAGGGTFIGLGSTLPVTGVPAFASSRSVDVATVPLPGVTQTTTVAVTLTDPTYAANGHFTKVQIASNVPGASVTSATAPALVDGESVQIFFGGPNVRTFVLHQGVLGHTYLFTIAFAVPNPFGVEFTHKPTVNILYAFEPAETICTTCTTGAAVAVPTLDGGTTGAGAMSVSIDQVSTWRTVATTTFSVVYAPMASPPPPPPPPLCATLAECPFAGPEPVTAGLASPNAIATDRRGNLYLSEKPSHQTATLSVLRPPADEGADPDEADADGGAAAPTGGKTELYRVTAVAPFTSPTIGSPSFDAAGNAYLVVAEHVTGDLLHVRRAIVRLDRRTHQAREIFVAEGSDPALGQPASAGIAVDRDGAVYFGRFNVLYRLARGGSPVAIATFTMSARITSWPLVENDGSIVVIVQDGSLSAIYSVRQDGSVVRIAHLQPTARGVSGFVYLGADAAGNVFTTQRVPHAFQRFSCAFSTTMRVLLLDGRAVRTSTSEVAPREVASTTQAGHLGLTASDQTFFRVSARGDVFFGVYPFVPFCPPAPLPPYPLSNQAAARRLMAFVALPDGSLAPYLLLDLPRLPIDPDPDHDLSGSLALALRNGRLFVADGGGGNIVRFDR